MKGNKKFLIIGGVVLLLAVGGIGGFLAFNQEKKDATENAEVEEGYLEDAKGVYDSAKENNVKDADELFDVEIDFEGLKNTNQDVVGWIKVPGTNIDYPVLQNKEEEDDYYLERTLDGQVGLPGSIYMEKYDASDFSDNISILYGHTLHDGTMFSELKKYREREFFDENPYIYIYYPEGVKKYQIFASVAFDDRYLIMSYAFTYDKDFNQYITDLKSCMDGNINEDLKVEFGDNIVTLSTCIDEFPDQRWLVNGVLIDEKRY
ncbi:MAG: class B sortase [Eubacterium sp.]|nr:class B sortase [Eubacterium sp.]